MLTQSELKMFLHYDPETGVFTWIKGRRGHWGNRPAGYVTKRDYVRIKIKQVEYQSQNLVWLYVYGRWPDDVVDHKDHNPSNNKLNNLREATNSQNGANKRVQKDNKLGLKGACRVGDKYQAQLKKNGKTIYLGLFETAELAHQAYVEAARAVHGEFACGGD